MYNYLFGTPALPRKPTRTNQADWFVLGAYPSAIHVRWDPEPGTEISAVAVADEPEPFWQGEDQDQRIQDWANALPWNPDWGHFSSAGKRNGSSGEWLFHQVLVPLRISRVETWITDCLDTYHESDEARDRLREPGFRAVLARHKIKDRILPPHPDTGQIVAGAQFERLRNELLTCRPKSVITLGNAAIQVFGKLLDGPPPIGSLSADSGYGESFVVQVAGLNSIELLPLAHPGARRDFPQVHATWREARLRDA